MDADFLKSLCFSQRVKIVIGLSMLLVSTLCAGNGSEIETKLINRQYHAAYRLTEQALLEQPQNPALMLQRGVALMGLGEQEAAAAVFEKLRQAHPGHAAPLVNLAAARAQQNRLEEARGLLVQALERDNKLTPARQSLANVYLGLAWQTYKQIADEIGEQPELKKKIAAIESLLRPNGESPNPARSGLIASAQNAYTPASAPQTAAAPLKSSSLAVEAPATPAPAPTRLKSEVAISQPTTTTSSQPLNTPRVIPARFQTNDGPLKATPPNLLADSGVSDEAAVRNTLEAWRQAWVQADLGRYARFYAHDFVPPQGRSRGDWLEYKHRVFTSAGKIRVDLNVKQLEINSEYAQVELEQAYRSNLLQDQTNKRLALIRTNEGWKILREDVIAKRAPRIL